MAEKDVRGCIDAAKDFQALGWAIDYCSISCCLCAQRSGREISSIYTDLAELLRRWRMSRQMDLDFGWVRLMLLWQKVMSQLSKPTKALVVVEFLKC